MRIVDAQQGSVLWHEWRVGKFPASKAPEMMGCGYKSRGAYLRTYGETDEASAFMQAKFEEGHKAEEAAIWKAMELIGGNLLNTSGEIEPDDFPKATPAKHVEALSGKLSASFDGITEDYSTIWEHKLWSKKNAACVANGSVPLQHQYQMQQQMLLAGAKRGLFMISTPDQSINEHCWLDADLEMQCQIITGWIKFDKDLKALSRREQVDATDDATWLELERELIYVHDQRAAIDEKLKKLEGIAINFADGRDVLGTNYTLKHYERAGSVSYAKIVKDKLPDLDLDEYRGETTTSIQLKRSASK